MTKTIPEQRLLDYTRCPLRPQSVGEGVLDTVAAKLVQRVAAAASDGPVPELRWIRNEAEKLYKASTGSPDLKSSRGLIRLSRRLHDLFLGHEVLWPGADYRLDVGLLAVEGSLTVLWPRRRPATARVLRLRPRGWPSVFAPDVVSLSRWLYGLRESGFPSCAVYNYWIWEDLAVSENFSEPLAVRWLSAAVEGYTRRRDYPAPGSHCSKCPRPCETARLWTAM